jgi:hypothetical protein
MSYSVTIPIIAPLTYANSVIEVRNVINDTLYGSTTLDAVAQGFVQCVFPDSSILSLKIVNGINQLSVATWDYRTDTPPNELGLDALIEDLSYVRGKFEVIPADTPALVIPASNQPGMVTLAVALRDGRKMRGGIAIEVSMIEDGSVYLDGAYEVDKTFIGETQSRGEHTGIAFIDVFASQKLVDHGYNGLYKVEAPGVCRNVWIPDEGGELGMLPSEAPV